MSEAEQKMSEEQMMAKAYDPAEVEKKWLKTLSTS